MRFEDKFEEYFADQDGIHYIKRVFVEHLKEEWPQINNKTKIERQECRFFDVIMHDDRDYKKSERPRTKTIITKSVEPPVFNPAICPIFQQWKKKEIITKREVEVIQPARIEPSYFRQTLEMKTFGLYDHCIGGNFICSCAYWPMTDTLYIK